MEKLLQFMYLLQRIVIRTMRGQLTLKTLEIFIDMDGDY